MFLVITYGLQIMKINKFYESRCPVLFSKKRKAEDCESMNRILAGVDCFLENNDITMYYMSTTSKKYEQPRKGKYKVEYAIEGLPPTDLAESFWCMVSCMVCKFLTMETSEALDYIDSWMRNTNPQNIYEEFKSYSSKYTD